VAEFNRQGIDMLLEREQRHLPGQLTFGGGRETGREVGRDTSRDADVERRG